MEGAAEAVSCGVRRFPGRVAGCGRYGLFDRHGGVSRGPYASLNVGLGGGDEATAVAANRSLVRRQMGVSRLLSGHQVHGDRVYLLESLPAGDVEVEGYDALITRVHDVGLVIQHADCQAVLLYDPVREAIGAAHSGWRGSVANIIARTVEAMTSAFATDPRDLLAVISPSLGPCCAEFVNYQAELPKSFHSHMDERHHVDFWAISLEQLMACGVAHSSVTLPEVCTSCSNDYFSYRRACRQTNGVTGRNCSVVALVAG